MLCGQNHNIYKNSPQCFPGRRICGTSVEKLAKNELLQMSGYSNSAFLMRSELGSNVIVAMKWYSEFGELYQTNFKFKGTTADRARSAMLFRLMTVLLIPENTDTQKREKMIKPDYTYYHQKTVYTSAYCPQALLKHLVSYLFEETDYELNGKPKVTLLTS